MLSSRVCSYQDHFRAGTTGTNTSKIFALYTVGQMVCPILISRIPHLTSKLSLNGIHAHYYHIVCQVAAFIAGPIADRFGRRVGMFVGGAFIILGAILACAAKNMDMLIGARFVLGFGICIVTTAAPSCRPPSSPGKLQVHLPERSDADLSAQCCSTDAVEIAPPQFRGRMTGFYNCGWFGGAIPAALVVYGCQYIHGNLSWRLPLILQCVPAGIVMIAVFFLPGALLRASRQPCRLA